MKTLNVIKQIIPLLSSIQQGGIFSHPVASLTKTWVDRLAEAANEDGIDITDTLNVIEAIGTAQDFESQQDEMVTALTLLDELLEKIPAGEVPEFIAPAESFRAIRLRLSVSICSILESYRPQHSDLDKLRKDAVNLSALAMGEKDLTPEDRASADRAYDLIDRSIDADYHGRRAMLTAARAQIERIAV
jgi:hypothetical protein